ncbi:hypothetical protein BpHYR1_032082 [Brachionus plicatilis]|uniref:Uncharacterized protein n=1 Tax=Brachionus plicatilis TaxID=10195 RepID=A0A3M7T7S9_BRAPC|nr:hypothetical protein BpHYR1_032082 [Brachionus plicatilis]
MLKESFATNSSLIQLSVLVQHIFGLYVLCLNRIYENHHEDEETKKIKNIFFLFEPLSKKNNSLLNMNLSPKKTIQSQVKFRIDLKNLKKLKSSFDLT